MISPYPTLHPQMLLPPTDGRTLPFPFDQAGLRYFYLARNGIYHLAREYNLADEEVLLPAYCHGVELEALRYAGVQISFFPVHQTMQVHAEDIMSRVTPRTRAIYLIHYLGFPAPVDKLAEFCRRRGILLIEDCALALLSCLGTTPLGSFGDASIFCLYKTLPVPNGGALLVRQATNGHARLRAPSVASTVGYTLSAMFRWAKSGGGGKDPRDALLSGARESAKFIATQLGLVKVGTSHFDVSHANLAMSHICGRVIAAQEFDRIVERRRNNFLQLVAGLKHTGSVVFYELPAGVCPLFFPLRAREKLRLMGALADQGVEAVNFWFDPKTAPGLFPEVDELRQTVVELPCHQDLTSEAVDRIVDRVCAFRHYL